MSRLRSIVSVCLAVLGVVFLTAAAFTSSVEPSRVTAQRVTATPIPTPSPTPSPIPVVRAYAPGPPICQQMTNPGGGLTWIPSADAGPWQTGGSIELPSQGRSAPIVKVGIDRSSQMVVPKNARDVAWLDQGPFPGRTQNAVLAGHINYSGRAGTFNQIDNLREGDPVVVTLDGTKYTFRVTWVCSFPRDTELADQIMGYTDVPSVTLISCGGVFDRRARTHTNRIAVRAELVSQQPV